MRQTVAVLLFVLSVPCFAVECRTRPPSASIQESLNMHAYLAQMREVSAVKIGLEDTLRAIARAPGYERVPQFVENATLIRSALQYIETVCLPITKPEQQAVATLFIGVLSATQNVDPSAIETALARSTDAEKAAKKAAWIGARRASGDAVERVVTELTGEKIGEIAGKYARGGPVGVAVGILLGASEIGPGDTLPGPGGQPGGTAPGSDHEHPSIHEGNINDAPTDSIEHAGTLAYVSVPTKLKQSNRQRIAKARGVARSRPH